MILPGEVALPSKRATLDGINSRLIKQSLL